MILTQGGRCDCGAWPLSLSSLNRFEMSRKRHIGVIVGLSKYWSYSSYQNLPAVSRDIEKMKEMLYIYDEGIIKSNIKDIRRELQEIVLKCSIEERFHFHYSMCTNPCTYKADDRSLRALVNDH